MKKFKDIIFTIAFPLVTFIIMEFLCMTFKNRHVISSVLDMKTWLRNSGVVALTAFAFSFNLSCGRFDLSLGAQRLAGTVVGGFIAISIGLSGVWLLVFALIFGLIFGLITGVIFVTLRVPPMILGIGMALILECIPYKISGGKGLNLFGVKGTEILTDTAFTIILIVASAVFVSIIMNSTRFGYQMKCIQGSQLIARNSGIDIFKHTVICYTLAGGLVCIAGMMESAFTTQMMSVMGMASTDSVMISMFAMMLGSYIGTRSNQATGIIVGSMVTRLVAQGLTIMEFSEPNSNLVNQILFMTFLVFMANKDIFAKKKAEAERIALARATKLKLNNA